MSDPSRLPYDLATAAHDYAAWSGAPRQTVIVATHPRSGSTLLGEALYAAGGLGCPLEYLHTGFRPSFVARWQAPDLATFIAALHRHRTAPTGVLGIKLFWRDVRETLQEARGGVASGESGDADDGEAVAALRLLSELLPNPTFVHLVRRDRVRAAVSAYVAEETRVFRALDAETLARTRAHVPYDYARILGRLAAIDRADARWRAFFAANRITPIGVDYESLTTRYDTTVRALLARLGSDAPAPAPRLSRQSADVSERLVLQFLRDDSQRREQPRPTG